MGRGQVWERGVGGDSGNKEKTVQMNSALNAAGIFSAASPDFVKWQTAEKTIDLWRLNHFVCPSFARGSMSYRVIVTFFDSL